MHFNRYGRIVLAVATATIQFAAMRAPAHGAPVVAVAIGGQQAPGFPTGDTYQQLSIPAINDAGLVVYSGTTNASSPDIALWMENGGSESLLYKTGAALPAGHRRRQHSDICLSRLWPITQVESHLEQKSMFRALLATLPVFAPTPAAR